MKAEQRSTVVGVFEDRVHADKAVAELHKAGFTSSQIGVAMRHDEGAVDPESHAAGAESGALTGALTGLGLGALAGLGVLAGVIPVVGPAIAAGTLGVILTNAAAGAGIAGLVGALVGAGVPQHEAEFYQGEFEAGRTVVTVSADGKADEATAILRRNGAYDMSTRGTTVGAAPAGARTTAKTTAATHASTTPTSAAGRGATGDTFQVKEEQLVAQKKSVEAGEVRVHKEVHTEHKTIDVPVSREEIVIERTPVHGKATAAGVGNDLREGEEIRIPVREDQVDVSKRAVVTEEVKVGKRVVHDTEKVSGDVRKEEIKIDETGDVDVRTKGTGKTTR